MKLVAALLAGLLLLVLPARPAVAETDASDAGLENLALNHAAYQSDSADDDHTAHLATDGSTTTYWESSTNRDSWISVDLGAERSFTRLVLHWGKSYATAYRVEISHDGLHPATWREIYATTSGHGGDESIAADSVTARHVRLVIAVGSNAGFGCRLSEFEVYGSRITPPDPPAEFTPGADGSVTLSGGNWKVQNALFLNAAPADISRADFDDHDWIPAVVPGTVLGSYAAFGAVPDPWYGDQMSQISEFFFSRNDFWYRCHFPTPAAAPGRRLWLDFDGINWKAEIFLNGTPVGRIDGAFIRGHFDITSLARPGTTNYLAVLIHHVAHPGPGVKKVMHKKIGSPTVNGDVLGRDSPTFLASAGWNWLPIVRGRDIGIWNEVHVRTSGEVEITDPWVVSKLSLPDASHADLTVKAGLCNHGEKPRTGEIAGEIGGITFRHQITLAPGTTTDVVLAPSMCPELSLANPRLWWPNGYGDQPLYTLNLRFECDGTVSDRRTVTFGIRDIAYVITNRVLTFYVNGRRILCRGGNWGMDDGLLNCDDAGYDLRVRLHHDANLNLIRNWVGMVGRDGFYAACDRYGMLVWDDFWLANPADGPNPADPDMFMANARDKIRRVRSHPSLALYCGRNEGQPPPQLDVALRAAVNELDGTRYYIPDSATGAVTGFGPYDDQNPEWYFANRGRTLHSELGIVAMPGLDSLRAMMPAQDLWPINDLWAVHDYQSPRSRLYTRRIEQRYGAATGIEDYCRKAQMVNLESAKAMYECLQGNQGSGVLVWMTQAAWPALICQLYDYYFDPTAAYFGAKKACEPLHILWDSNADVVKAANDTGNDLTGLKAEARAYDLEGNELWRKSMDLDLPSTSVKECFPIERPVASPSVFFLKLKLLRGGQVLSDNFYWAGSRGGSCTGLNRLPPVSPVVTAARSDDGRTCRLAVDLRNPGRSVALMIHLKIIRAHSGVRVLPVFYDDNYFSLLPGERRTVPVSFATASLAGESPAVAVDGWNIPPAQISVP